MSVTTFGTLKTAISGVIGRTPADVCFQMTTEEINRDMRLLAMEATTTVAEAATVSLPADFLDMVSVYRDSDPRRALVSTTDLALNRDHHSSGSPSKFSIVDDAGTKKLVLDAPGNGSNLVIRYMASLDVFSADDDTNDVLTQHPDIYLYGALSHHGRLVGDSRAQAWMASYQEAKRTAKVSDANIRNPHPYHVVPPGATP